METGRSRDYVNKVIDGVLVPFRNKITSNGARLTKEELAFADSVEKGRDGDIIITFPTWIYDRFPDFDKDVIKALQESNSLRRDISSKLSSLSDFGV